MLNIQIKRFLGFESSMIGKIFDKNVEVHSYDNTGGFFRIKLDGINPSDEIKKIISNMYSIDTEAYVVSFIEELDSTTFWVGSKQFISTRKFNKPLLTMDVLKQYHEMESTYQAKRE